MGQYFLTGKKPTGKTVTELVEADSAKAAIKALEDRSYHDVLLHTEDFIAQVIRPTDPQTARDIHRNRYRNSIARTFFVALRMYRVMWKSLALIIASFLLRRAMNVPWGIFDGILGAALLLPPILARSSRSAVISYHRLLEAESWYRWQEALQIHSAIANTLPAYAAAWHQAKALAGLDRLDEAVAVFEPFASSDTISPSRFWFMMACVYRIAKRYDLAIPAHEKALEFSSDDPAMLLALATAVVEDQADVRRAKELLRRALQQPLGDLTRHRAIALEGLIALEEGNARLAVEKLAGALCEERRLAKGLPTTAAVADILEGRLALAKAMAGDLPAARRHFLRAEPRLRALKRDVLLGRCEKALA